MRKYITKRIRYMLSSTFLSMLLFGQSVCMMQFQEQKEAWANRRIARLFTQEQAAVLATYPLAERMRALEICSNHAIIYAIFRQEQNALCQKFMDDLLEAKYKCMALVMERIMQTALSSRDSESIGHAKSSMELLNDILDKALENIDKAAQSANSHHMMKKIPYKHLIRLPEYPQGDEDARRWSERNCLSPYSPQNPVLCCAMDPTSPGKWLSYSVRPDSFLPLICCITNMVLAACLRASYSLEGLPKDYFAVVNPISRQNLPGYVRTNDYTYIVSERMAKRSKSTAADAIRHDPKLMNGVFNLMSAMRNGVWIGDDFQCPLKLGMIGELIKLQKGLAEIHAHMNGTHSTNAFADC